MWDCRFLFLTNKENHNLDTRQRNNLYLPQANLTIYKNGAYYSRIKIFNKLPLEIKNIADNQKNLKLLYKKFYTRTHFTQLTSTLVNHELRSISQDIYGDIPNPRNFSVCIVRLLLNFLGSD
jgi:hypothetical protein